MFKVIGHVISDLVLLLQNVTYTYVNLCSLLILYKHFIIAIIKITLEITQFN